MRYRDNNQDMQLMFNENEAINMFGNAKFTENVCRASLTTATKTDSNRTRLTHADSGCSHEHKTLQTNQDRHGPYKFRLLTLATRAKHLLLLAVSPRRANVHNAHKKNRFKQAARICIGLACNVNYFPDFGR